MDKQERIRTTTPWKRRKKTSKDNKNGLFAAFFFAELRACLVLWCEVLDSIE